MLLDPESEIWTPGSGLRSCTTSHPCPQHTIWWSADSALLQLAIPINGTAVEQLLKPTSSVPTIVCHVFFPVVLSLTIEAVECFHTTSFFNVNRIFVVDMLHEFELGIWKALFIHLIRILHAAMPHGELVEELNNRWACHWLWPSVVLWNWYNYLHHRFHQIPTFGSTGTICRFATNASEMKKLAGRDLYRMEEWVGMCGMGVILKNPD